MNAEAVRGGLSPRARALRERPAPEGAPWRIEDIAFDRIDRDLVRDDDRLFNLVAAASFIEITSDAYTRNLVVFCSGDDEVVRWLEDGWQREEIQHGVALRRYVETAWPEFDWETAYRNFLVEYSEFCKIELLAETRALEMAARCVVETGTSSFYRMLSDASPEPVLSRLAAFISADEVSHYKHFYRYFRRFAETERPSRWTVLRALLGRIAEIDAEDAACAYKHVRLVSGGGASGGDDYAAFRQRVRDMALEHYRYDMAVKMLLKPLGLGGAANRIVVPTATGLTRLLLFR